MMDHGTYRTALFSALMFVACCQTVAQEADDSITISDIAGVEESREPILRKELLRRAKKDQEARTALLDWAKDNNIHFGSPEFPQRGRPLIDSLLVADAENRRWLSTIIKKYGWPVRSLVAKDGASAAFLLVQHANEDLPFQKQCLELMRQARTGEVAPQHVAYLTDRILRAEGKPQVYGTQVEFKNGCWQAEPVESPESLDERRHSMEMPPMREYLEHVSTFYDSSPRP